MSSLLRKPLFLTIFFIGLSSLPSYAQEHSTDSSATSFIQKGKILTGFSLSFINASREDYNQEFAREFTDLSVQVDGLYFVTDHIGVGPLLGYRFTYRDLEDPYRGPDQSDIDTRTARFEFGAKGGWYVPAAELFGGAGDTEFFVDGGASLLRNKYGKEGGANQEGNYQFGLQVGTGFLFPLGKQIAFETKLGFHTYRKEYTVAQYDANQKIVIRKENKWLKEVALSVGVKVTF